MSPPAPHDEITRLARLQSLFILDTAREPLFDSFVRLAAEACAAPIALISLVDADRQWLKADVGLGGVTETPRAWSFCTFAIQSDELLEIPDARDDPRVAGSPLVQHDPGLRFYAGAPLVMPCGARVGTLCVVDTRVRRLDDAQRRMLGELAQLTVQAMLMRRDLIERSRAVRSEADRALAAREAELDDLYTNAPCGYYSLDGDGRFVRINDTALRWLGCPRDEVLGKLGILDFMDGAGAGHFRARFPRLMLDGSTFDVEYDLVGRDGSRRRVIGSASAVNGPDGRFLMTRTTIHDISELHRVREHLRRLSAEQRSIIDTDLVAIIKLKDRRIVWANKGAEKMLDCPLSEMVGRSSRDFYVDDSAWQDFGVASAARLASGGIYRRQMRMRRLDGSTLTVDSSVTPMAGQPGEVLCVLVDITELKQAEETRIRANALEAENRQLVEAARVKGVFLSNMSHELYTPLNAIIGFAHLLGTGAIPHESPRFAKYLADIGASGQQLLAQVQQVLALTDVESGRFELRPQAVALPELLQGVADIAREAGRVRGVAVEVHLDAAPATLTVDPMRLSQVVSHCLSNAVRFSHAGGRVRLRAAADGPLGLRIEVQDEGVGIAPDDLPRLFTPFRQLSEGLARTHQGAGLGLALTRRLVEALGGTIAAASIPGIGSTFTIALPLAPQSI